VHPIRTVMPQSQLAELGMTYPALFVRRRTIQVVRTDDELIITSAYALKRGHYSDSLLVDDTGRSRRIARAEKVGGVGWLWGWNVFLNQRIRVRLVPADGDHSVTLEEVKALVRKNLRDWGGWATRGDFEELKAKVEKAGTVAVLIQLMDDSVSADARESGAA
jgi:hypothetical protein